MQTVDAEAFRRKRFWLKAYVRTGELKELAQVQLWARVDRMDGSVGFFDNMSDRPIQAANWTKSEIVGDVDDDALTISFGLLIQGSGEAWLDEVSLSTLPRPRVKDGGPRALSERGLANLTTFARLVGYVQYFHPSDQAATTDWDKFIITHLPLIETASSTPELVIALQSAFRAVGPTVQIGRTDDPMLKSFNLVKPKGSGPLQTVRWVHRGYGQGSQNNLYRSDRIVDADTTGARTTPSVGRYSLSNNLVTTMPLVLYRDATGTLPHADRRERAPPRAKHMLPPSTARDRTTRLATVIIAWNIFQHFHPYLDEIAGDWQGALGSALERAALDVDERQFIDTLRLLMSKLQDGHASVTHPTDERSYFPPFSWDWIEDRLVITRVEKEAAPLMIGDVISTIDGRSSDEAILAAEKYVSGATSAVRRRLALRRIAEGVRSSKLLLEVSSPQYRQLSIVRSVAHQTPIEGRPPKIHELKPGVIYVDLTKISDEELGESLPKLQYATGIVFDLRGYPRVSPEFIGYFTERQAWSPQWLIPVIAWPDHKNVEFKQEQQWSIEPRLPRLTAKIVVLEDDRAFSQAETDLAIIKHNRLATIVGSPSGGTNGDINRVMLPGGYTVRWTGMKVLNQDGSQHHGIGILPTVRVSRTVKGVAEGRDEILEKGVQALMELTTSQPVRDAGSEFVVGG